MAAHMAACPAAGSRSHGSGPSRMQDTPHSARPTQMVGNRPALSLISLQLSEAQQVGQHAHAWEQEMHAVVCGMFASLHRSCWMKQA
jgi:hypothetical protein